jgi:MFS family permease/quinol monooxygenase YgiN
LQTINSARRPAVTTPQGGTWQAFHYPLFRAMWTASVVSNIGTWMQDVGAGWLMTSLAPSPLLVALVQAATTLPIVLLALPAGAWADIVDRRRYLIGTQLWMLIMAAVLGFFTLTGVTTAGLLLAFTFALGCGAALTWPAWAAMVPELVPRSELHSAIALNSMGINVARAIGPALAGFIIAVTGPGTVFLLNAASFLGIVVVLSRWQRAPRQSALPAERFFSALRAGLRYARHAPRLQAVLIREGAFFIFASAPWALLPLLVRRELGAGPGVYGILVACIGAGAVAGALYLPRLRTRLTYDALVLSATLAYTATMLVLAHVHNLYLLGVAMLLSGTAWITILSSLHLTAQTALPEWVRARGLALFMVMFMAGMAGGSALWGQVANLAGIPLALTAATVGALGGLALTWRFRLGDHELVDFTPSMHWPAPLVNQEPEPDQGPVLVTLEYRIDPANRQKFLDLMQELRRIRRRDGAFFWELFHDTANPERFLECFMLESWLEHLRQHERVTVVDRQLQEQVKQCLADPTGPQVAHYVASGAAKSLSTNNSYR